jgi:carbon monoxide dehydrogenase subunit G
MRLEGSYEMPAPRAAVWAALLDPDRLRQAIPGCETLEPVGEDEYRAIMKVGIAAVRGTFEGKVRLADRAAAESYRMRVEGRGPAGFVHGDATIRLSDVESGTRVAYSAELAVGGLIAGVGQRMLGSVSRGMADRFFARMAELVRGSR